MKTVAIVSQKGGSGKTTLAVNLAVCAHHRSKTALVIDIDMQASAHSWHQARAQARDETEPQVLPTHHAALANVLKGAKGQGVDLVLIDTAAKTETDTRVAVEAADVVLIPCRPSAMDVRAIMNTVRLCQHQGKNPYVVLTQTEPQGTAAEETRATLQQLGVNVMPGSIGRRAAFIHSINDGRGASEYEPNGKASQEIRSLYAAINKLAG